MLQPTPPHHPKTSAVQAVDVGDLSLTQPQFSHFYTGRMAFFWIILIGLVGIGLASVEEIGKSQVDESPQNIGASDPDDVYRQIAREIRDMIKSRRRIPQLIGQNEFEAAQSRKQRHRASVELPQERFERVKRSFLAPACGVEDEKVLVGKNDFGSGTTPKQWLRKSWDQVRANLDGDRNLGSFNEIPAARETPFPPGRCFVGRKLKLFETVANLTSSEKEETDDDKMFKKSPSDFIDQYASKRQTGCGCELNHNSIGCACCLYWEGGDIIICAGCGYLFEDMAFIVRITVEDFTIFKWEKEIAKSAFTKYLALFSKSLCLPHEFSVVVTACLELSLNFIPSFSKNVHSKIAACPSIVGQFFLFYDLALLELPCWELEFDLPFLRIAGKPDMARLTFENKQVKIKHPVKTMFAVENFKEVGKVVRELGRMERNESRRPLWQGKGKIVQNVGEEPRALKTGNATVPINWEPIEMSKLHYMVVLYTQPLASPLSMKDLESKDMKEIPSFRSMMLDGLDRRYKDPSYLNLRVHASMGRSCGGVILTPDKILTLCACIKFFYLYHKYQRKPQDHDHQDVFTLVAPDIYVTFADRSFTADQIIYELDQDVKRFMKKSKCFDAIERTIGKNRVDASFTDTLMHAVVMPVTREFKNIEKLTLAWLDVGGARTAPTPAEMTVIGMRKRKYMDMFDAAGYEFDPLYEVVKVPFVSCPKTSFCRKVLSPTGTGRRSVSKEFDDTTLCFCAKDPNFQLCDGVVGFPVVTSEGLIGLNALPMHCQKEGSVIVALLSKAAIAEIDDHISGNDVTPSSDPDSPGEPHGVDKSTKRPLGPGSESSPEPFHSTGPTAAATISMTIVSLSVLTA